MAHENKHGLLSSWFGKKTDKDEIEAAQLESRRKLEERIRQILSDRVEAPELLMSREESTVVMAKHEEIAPQIELLPITASVNTSTPKTVRSSFLIAGFDSPPAYAANER